MDDEAPVLQMVGRLLAMRGYKVLTAESGQRAIEAANEHNGPIHLLLSDVVMPGMSGPDLASELQRLRSGMKVLLMSGYDQSRTVLERSWTFIAKPFAPNELFACVREMLDRPATRTAGC
ncbi:MAG: response regulator [Chloroflexi bacterium]|nr:response regulator [Chloroflexota bacterium]